MAGDSSAVTSKVHLTIRINFFVMEVCLHDVALDSFGGRSVLGC
jgi:hypothetical protein